MISAIAPAKINLTFLCGPLRSDSYHEVASIYQALDFFEEVAVTAAPSWAVEVHSDAVQEQSRVPQDTTNIVVKAAIELAASAGIQQVQTMKFVITKQVPPAGGMAGGSADAAAALVALNQAWGLKLSTNELLEVAARVGADVPFAVLGGTALGTDSGIELATLKSFPESHVLLIFSTPGLSTATVFQEFDRLTPGGDLQMSASELASQYAADPAPLVGLNSLQQAAFELRSDLEALSKLVPGKKAFVSGSGPTLFMISQDLGDIHSWQEVYAQAGFKTLVTRTSSRGAELIS